MQYQTSFGSCPTRNAGALTLLLVNEFNKTHSLWALKKRIVNENLEKKHFLSGYQILFDPLQKNLKFNFTCPAPLMRVQIYKDLSQELYDGILVDNGDLFDPTYEVLLKSEKEVFHDLPFLALPYNYNSKVLQKQIASLMNSLPMPFRKKISEIIVGEDKSLTIILSLEGHPSSAFLGFDLWEEKGKILQKIIPYLEKKKKVPSTVNLTNSKKVVVKFSDTF